jgi:hypothetical protein
LFLWHAEHFTPSTTRICGSTSSHSMNPKSNRFCRLFHEMNSNVFTLILPFTLSMLAARYSRPSRLGFVSAAVLTGVRNDPLPSVLSLCAMTTRGRVKPESSATAEKPTGSCTHSPSLFSARIISTPFLGTSLLLASRTAPMPVPAKMDLGASRVSVSVVSGAAGFSAGGAGVAGDGGTRTARLPSTTAVKTASFPCAVFIVTPRDKRGRRTGLTLQTRT